MKNRAARVGKKKKKKKVGGGCEPEENEHNYMRHAFSFIRTIKDSFILIFLDMINACPFWIRQMTAITAPQLGVSTADRCWI